MTDDRRSGRASTVNAESLLGELMSNWGEQLGHTMSITILWEPRVRNFLPYLTQLAESELVDLHFGSRIHQGE